MGTHLHLNITVSYLGYTSQRRVEMVCFERHFSLLLVETVRILYVVGLGRTLRRGVNGTIYVRSEVKSHSTDRTCPFLGFAPLSYSVYE